MNKKLYQNDPQAFCSLRIYDRKQKGVQSARRLVKCGDCDNSVEIYHGDNSLEINGVLGSIENWKEVLLPLMGIPYERAVAIKKRG